VGGQDVSSRSSLRVKLGSNLGIDLRRERRDGAGMLTLTISTSWSALVAPDPTPMRISPTKKAASVCLPAREEEGEYGREGREARNRRLSGAGRWRE
jgi:hypothetical protein